MICDTLLKRMKVVSLYLFHFKCQYLKCNWHCTQLSKLYYKIMMSNSVDTNYQSFLMRSFMLTMICRLHKFFNKMFPMKHLWSTLYIHNTEKQTNKFSSAIYRDILFLTKFRPLNSNLKVKFRIHISLLSYTKYNVLLTVLLPMTHYKVHFHIIK